MGNKKTISIALMVVGVVLLIGSLAIDAIGLGSSAGFGYKQILGIVAGVILAIAGFVLYSRK